MKSPPLAVCKNFNNIPDDLRKRPYFVVRKGKVPYDPKTGKPARTNQADTWSTFEQAVAACQSGPYDGIGIVIPKGANLVAIDLDTVYDPQTGWIDPTAKEIIDNCKSYTELSMSGNGMHIFGICSRDTPLPWIRHKLAKNQIQRPEVDRKTGEVKTDANGNIVFKTPELEIYTKSQYIAITGNTFGPYCGLRDLTDEVNTIVQRFTKPDQLTMQTSPPVVSPSHVAPAASSPPSEATPTLEVPDASSPPLEATPTLGAPDASSSPSKADPSCEADAASSPTQATAPQIEQILEKARKAKNGAKFSKLMAGDLSEYNGDHSRADLALCSMVAYWTYGNRKVIDAIFRTSGLMRAKWDEQRGGKTYGELTIDEAIKNYQKNPPRFAPSAFEPTSDHALALQKGGELDSSGKALIDQISALEPIHHISLINSELGGAQLFAHIFGAFCKYDSATKQWYIYDGKKWTPDNIRIMGQCHQLAIAVRNYVLSIKFDNPDLQKAAHSAVKLWTRRSFREKLLKDAEVYCAASASDFDRAGYLLNVQNGTLNLKDFSLHKHSPDDMITKIAAVTYDPKAKSEVWENFLHQVFDGDEETLDYVQRIMGYSLLGCSPEECFFVFYGKTRAGKDTFLTPVLAMLGQDYAKTAAPETIAFKKFSNGSAPSEDLVRLSGTRLAVVDEPDKCLHLNSGLIKRISGNNAITARGVYARSSVEITPTFSLILVTNYLPNIDDPTIYNSNRFRIVLFEHQFAPDEQDNNLKEKLCDPAILSAVLNWCLEGLYKYYKRGLVAPAKSQDMLQNLSLDCDLLGTFFKEELVADPEVDTIVYSIYPIYEKWCEQRHYKPEPYNTFLHLVEARYTVHRDKRPRHAGRKASAGTILVGYRAKSCSGNDYDK